MKTFAKSLLVAGVGMFGTVSATEAATPWQQSAYSRSIAPNGCYEADRWNDNRQYHDTSYDDYAGHGWNDSRWNDSYGYDSYRNDSYRNDSRWEDSYRSPSRQDRWPDDSYVSWNHDSRDVSWSHRPLNDDWRYDSRHRNLPVSWSDRDRYDSRSQLFEPWRPANPWENGYSY